MWICPYSPKRVFHSYRQRQYDFCALQGGIPARRDEQNAMGAWIVRVQRGEKTLHNHSFHRPKEQDWRPGIYARGRLPVDGLIPKLFARFAVEPSEEWGSHGANGCFSAMRSFSRFAVVRMWIRAHSCCRPSTFVETDFWWGASFGYSLSFDTVRVRG